MRDWRRWVLEIVFGAVALYAAWPIWAVEHPPIQDLPQHLAAVRILADYGDPELAFAQYFTIDLTRTQYLAYYLVAIVLSWPLGVLVANKLLIAISIVATPYAMRSLLRALGRDERLALFVVPLTWNAHLILGFMNFVGAIPLMLVGLALAVRLREVFSIRRAVLLGVVSFVCFYTHVVPFAFLGLGAALIAIGEDWRRTGMRWLPLVPAAIASLVWAKLSPAGRSTVTAASGVSERASFVGPLQAFTELPMWLTDVLASSLDEELLFAFGLLLLLAAVTGGGGSERPLARTSWRRIAPFGPLAGVLYFVTPAGYDWIWPINARFALLAIVFLVPALPRARGLAGAIVLAGVVTLSVASTSEVTRAFVAFDRDEVGTLDAMIRQMPKGARVAGLIFDRGSRYVKYSPFIHSAAWAQARNGGAVMFTFADFPQSPFTFREDRRPPRVPPRWEWLPHAVDPARDLAWFDYVLVRGGPGRIAQQPQAFALVASSGPWRVYRRVAR